MEPNSKTNGNKPLLTVVQGFGFFSESNKKPPTFPGRGRFPMGQVKMS